MKFKEGDKVRLNPKGKFTLFSIRIIEKEILKNNLIGEINFIEKEFSNAIVEINFLKSYREMLGVTDYRYFDILENYTVPIKELEKVNSKVKRIEGGDTS